MFDFFEENLENRKQNHLYRKLCLPSSDLLDFTSNDYLNLSSHPVVRKKMISALEAGIPLSSRASRLLGGHSSWHEKLEETFKNWLDRPAVLSFSSGYQANLGIIPSLAKERVVFSDELNHASLIDGIRLSHRPYCIFQHNDLNHLESLLKKTKEKKLIVTESLFSMAGDFSPLEELSQLAIKYQALLLVDEAHSTGLFGKELAGCVSHLSSKDHIVSVHTCGKALGSSGAFVASSSLIKEYLVNHCRSFIYTTAPPPLLMIQWLAGHSVLKKENFRAMELRKKALWFRKEINLPESESPVLFLILKGAGEALKTAQSLREKGFFVQAVRYPTVPEDRQGLRLVLHYDHTEEQLKSLKKNLLPLLSTKNKEV